MIPAPTLTILSGHGPIFSAAANDYFARLNAVGALIPEYRKPIAAYIDSLVALGGAYWDTMLTHCLFSGVGYNGCFVPLRSGMTVPTANNFVSGQHNAVTGLLGDGSNMDIDSNVPNSSAVQDDMSASIFINTLNTNNASYCGGGDSGGRVTISRSVSNPSLLSLRGQTSSLSNAGSGNATGFVGINRNISASFVVRSNSSNSTASVASLSPSSETFRVFRVSAASAFFSNARLKAYHFGPSLNLSVLDGLQTTLFNAIT